MAVQFNGTNYLQSVSNFTPTAQGSLSFWMNASNLPVLSRILGSDDNFEVRANTNTLYHDIFGTGPGTLTTLFTGILYHFVFTWNYTTSVAWQIYLNGNLDNSGTKTYSAASSNPFSLGVRTGTVNYFTGILDDVRIYNRVLSAGEVQTIYASRGIDNIVNGRIHRWLLDEGDTFWTPSLLSNCAGWYDSSDATTITSSSGLVSQLRDKSGNGLHMAQSTDSLKPETNLVTINSLNALVFDQDYMNTSSNPFGANVVDAHVFLVMRTSNPLVNGTAFSLTGGKGASNVSRWQSHCPYGNTNVYFDAGGTTGGVSRIQVDTLLTTSEVSLMSFYNSNTSGVQELWKNGTLEGSNATAPSIPVIDTIVIGDDGDGSTFQNMDFAEMIIINGTLSAAFRQIIEGYLMWKWGLQASIPIGHPYISYAPQETRIDEGTSKLNMNGFTNPVYVGSELQYRRPVHPQ